MNALKNYAVNLEFTRNYYIFAVNLGRCMGSCNTLNDLFNEVCVPNKTGNLNLSVFNMTTQINESKTLNEHISCKCKCKLESRKCNSNQKWNNHKCWCEYKIQNIKKKKKQKKKKKKKCMQKELYFKSCYT